MARICFCQIRVCATVTKSESHIFGSHISPLMSIFPKCTSSLPAASNPMPGNIAARRLSESTEQDIYNPLFTLTEWEKKHCGSKDHRISSCTEQHARP